MCRHRSPVLMHATSFFGVSFARALHAADDTAPALLGTKSPAATHSGISHAGRIRHLRRCGIDASPPESLTRTEPPGPLLPRRRAGCYDSSVEKQLARSKMFEIERPCTSFAREPAKRAAHLSVVKAGFRPKLKRPGSGAGCDVLVHAEDVA